MLLRTYDLNPDGVRIVVHWNAFVVGSSIFVPCVNTTKTVQQLTAICGDNEWQTITKLRIENGRLGVRIWRTL